MKRISTRSVVASLVLVFGVAGLVAVLRTGTEPSGGGAGGLGRHDLASSPPSDSGGLGVNDSARGRTLLYDLNFRFEIGMSDQPERRTVAGSAKLAVHDVLGTSGRDCVGVLSNVDVTLLGAPPEDRESERQALTALEKSIAGPFAFRKDPNGSVAGFAYARRTEREQLGVARTAVAALQFQAPPNPAAKEWSVEETDPSGVCTMSYQVQQPDEYLKTKQNCRLMVNGATAAGGAQPPGALRGTTHVRRTGEGVTLRSDYQERAELSLGNGTVFASMVLSLAFAGERGEENPHPEYRGWAMSSLNTKPTPPEEDSRAEAVSLAAKKKLNGATFESLSAALSETFTSEKAGDRQRVLDRLTTLLDVEPSAAAQAAAAIRSGMKREQAEALMSAMASSESPAAQNELVHLAEDASLEAGFRDDAIVHLGLHEAPSELTLNTLSTLASDEPDEGLRQRATLALGGAVRMASDDEPNTPIADEAVTDLVEQSRSAASPDARRVAISALGNAGSGGAIEAVETALASDDPNMRSSAAFSLRFIAGQHAEELLANVLLADPEPVVRMSAASALGYRPMTPLLAKGVLMAVQQEPAPEVRSVLLTAMSKGETVPPESLAFPAVAWMAEHDTVPELQQRAEAALAQVAL